MTPLSDLCLQLFALTLGFGVLGWCLSSLAAPPPIWLGMGLTIGYVVWVGRAGLFLASVWITFLVSLVVGLKIFPPHWLEYFKYGFWPLSLMAFWAAGMGLFALLGNYVQSLPARHRLLWQGLALVAIGLGLAAGIKGVPHGVFLQP